MANDLDVVNDCLAIMGEAPLNSLTEDHTFKEAALNTLNRVNRQIQSTGWWFNMENYVMRVNLQDQRIYFPTDIGTIMPFENRPHLVQRGRVLYDLSRGTDRFELGQTFDARLVRIIPLADVPESVGAYIARQSVLDFQQAYDGDQTKTRNLMIEINGSPQMGIVGLKTEAKLEHIRNRRVNLIDSSDRMARIDRVTRRNSGTRLSPSGRTNYGA
jgi:hypothetical protein